MRKLVLLLCLLLITGCSPQAADPEPDATPVLPEVTAPAFLFGPQAHANRPMTVDEFVPVFAAQLALYNATAPSLWPNNAVVDRSVILEDVDTNRFWFITPKGVVSTYSLEQIEEMGISRRGKSDDFSFYEEGMYITISEQSVRQRVGGEKLHVGAYDSLLWLTHEGFHKWEQSDKWSKLVDEETGELLAVPNPGREEHFLDIPARAKRNLLQRQLMQAVANPEDPTLELEALATYADYKKQHSGDYQLTPYFDRIEGTANYYEVISSLYVFYPNQIKNKEDLANALAHLAKYEEDYIGLGVVSEAYTIGVFTCALLDRAGINWKERISQEPLLTPLEILANHHHNATLPAPQQLSTEDTEKVTEELRKKIRFLVERQIPILTELKQNLVNVPEEDLPIMEMFISQTMGNFEEMISILTKEEQAELADFIKSIKE